MINLLFGVLSGIVISFLIVRAEVNRLDKRSAALDLREKQITRNERALALELADRIQEIKKLKNFTSEDYPQNVDYFYKLIKRINP